MFVKYKDYIGQLLSYELRGNNVWMRIKDTKNTELTLNCKESEITIPNILRNSHILYEIQKEQDKQKAEGE